MPAEDTAVEEKTGSQETETAEAKSDAADAQAIKAVEAKMKDLGIPGSDATPAQEAAGETEKVERTDEKPKADEADSKVAESDKGDKPKPEDTDEDKPVTPGLTPSQRAAAKQLGYTDDEVAELNEAETKVLERAGDRLRRKMAEMGERLAESEAAETAPKGEGGKTGASDAAPTDIEFAEADLAEDGDILPKLNQLAAQNKDLRSKLAKLERDGQEDREAEIERSVDTFFEGLGEEYVDLYGKGPLAELDEDSAECKARVRVMDKAAPLRRAYAGTKQSITLEQSLNEGHAIVARDQIRASERKKLKKQLDKRSEQRIGQPGGKPKGKAPETTEERAIRKVREVAASIGASTKG